MKLISFWCAVDFIPRVAFITAFGGRPLAVRDLNVFNKII